MIIFFDASALIYLIEGHRPFADEVRAALKKHVMLTGDRAFRRVSGLNVLVPG